LEGLQTHYRSGYLRADAPRDEPLANAFCPTGPGGGVDPTCSPGGKEGAMSELSAKGGASHFAHGAVKHMSEHAVRQASANITSMKYATNKQIDRMTGGVPVFGFYKDETGEIVVSKQSHLTTVVLAHEIAHAIDKKPEGGIGRYSGTREFKAVWEKEIVAVYAKWGGDKDNAAESPAEGFAEIMSYVAMHGVNSIRGHMPGTAAYLLQHNLVEGSGGH
jgi:hypothetical protein